MLEPPRTFTKYILTERGRYLDVFYRSSGWFDWTFSEYIFSGARRSEGALGTSWMRFKHIEPLRTFSNYFLTELARYIDFFHTSSEKVRSSRTTPNSCEKSLYTLLAL